MHLSVETFKTDYLCDLAHVNVRRYQSVSFFSFTHIFVQCLQHFTHRIRILVYSLNARKESFVAFEGPGLEGPIVPRKHP